MDRDLEYNEVISVASVHATKESTKQVFLKVSWVASTIAASYIRPNLATFLACLPINVQPKLGFKVHNINLESIPKLFVMHMQLR